MAALAAVLLAEGAAYVGIQVTHGALDDDIRTVASIYREQTAQITELMKPNPARRLAIDPLLGWRYRSGYTSSTDHLNDQGVRARREYTITPLAGTLRVAAFGDSFVYGNEVADDDAWPTQLERDFSSIEVLNYGVGGYGLDQAYLRFAAEGTALNPQAVLVGFVADDLRRVVNVYRRFLSTRELPLFKPRFVLGENRELTLISNPVPDMPAYERYLAEPSRVTETGVHDRWYERAIYENPLHDLSATVRLGVATWIRLWRRYLDSGRLVRGNMFNEQSEAFAIQVTLFEAFAKIARERGLSVMVVFFPDRDVLARAMAGGDPVYGSLVTATRRRGIVALDLLDAFVEAGKASPPAHGLFAPGGHYSASGNAIVARAIGEKLLGAASRNRGGVSRAPTNPGVSRPTFGPPTAKYGIDVQN